MLWAVQQFDDDRISALAAGVMLLVSLWLCLGSLRLHPLSPVMIYLYVFGLFHLGLVVPWALDIHASVLPHWMLRYPLTPALTLVIAAITAYQLGATLAASRWSAHVAREAEGGHRYHNPVLFHLGFVVVLGGLGLFGWGIHNIGFGRFLQASYIETFELVQMYDPRLFITSLTFVPVGLYVIAASAPARRMMAVLALTVAWSSVVFFLGFRSFALAPLVVTLAVLTKRGFRLHKSAYVAGLLIVMVAIPVARSMRNNRLAERSVADALTEIHPLAAFEEMGGSLQPLVYTLRLMEDEDLRWGRTYWQALSRVMPNLALNWENSGYLAVEDLPPTHWVTRLAAPWKHRNYGGLGFSAIAEPYMNFGVVGVALYFLALAVALVAVERFDQGRPTRLALWAAMLGPLLMTTRGSFDSFFRPVIWGWVVVLCLRVVADSLPASRRSGAASRAPEPLRKPLAPHP